MERYGKMRGCDDLEPARWLELRHEAAMRGDAIAARCAPGYPAYARILHPAWRRGLDGVWSPRSWSQIATANGVPMHALISFEAVTTVAGVRRFGPPDLWTHGPAGGGPPAEVAQPLLAILARHTRSPETCWFGLWEGHESISDQIPDRVPRFVLPPRRYILLRGALGAVLSAEPLPTLPDRWWPDDRAWCLGGDVDAECTYLAGSAELIADVLAARDLEAYAVRPAGRPRVTRRPASGSSEVHEDPAIAVSAGLLPWPGAHPPDG